jgi:hypothetical protein
MASTKVISYRSRVSTPATVKYVLCGNRSKARHDENYVEKNSTMQEQDTLVEGPVYTLMMNKYLVIFLHGDDFLWSVKSKF